MTIATLVLHDLECGWGIEGCVVRLWCPQSERTEEQDEEGEDEEKAERSGRPAQRLP